MRVLRVPAIATGEQACQGISRCWRLRERATRRAASVRPQGSLAPKFEHEFLSSLVHVGRAKFSRHSTFLELRHNPKHCVPAQVAYLATLRTNPAAAAADARPRKSACEPRGTRFSSAKQCGGVSRWLRNRAESPRMGSTVVIHSLIQVGSALKNLSSHLAPLRPAPGNSRGTRGAAGVAPRSLKEPPGWVRTTLSGTTRAWRSARRSPQVNAPTSSNFAERNKGDTITKRTTRSDLGSVRLSRSQLAPPVATLVQPPANTRQRAEEIRWTLKVSLPRWVQLDVAHRLVVGVSVQQGVRHANVCSPWPMRVVPDTIWRNECNRNVS